MIIFRLLVLGIGKITVKVSHKWQEMNDNAEKYFIDVMVNEDTHGATRGQKNTRFTAT